MKGIQYTSREIYEAKKILYEGNDLTRKTLIVALAAFVKKNYYFLFIFLFLIILFLKVSLIFLLILSFHGDSDHWVCEINSNENSMIYFSYE
jgi:hypothetical protein